MTMTSASMPSAMAAAFMLAVATIAVGARVMDRFFPEADESLGFTILAQRRRQP